MRSKRRIVTPEFLLSPCAHPAADDEFFLAQVLVSWKEHRLWRPMDLGLNPGCHIYGVLCATHRPGSLCLLAQAWWVKCLA